MRNYKKENEFNKEKYDIIKVVFKKEDGKIIEKICKKYDITKSQFLRDCIFNSDIYLRFKEIVKEDV